MTFLGWLEISLLFLSVLILTKPLGLYLYSIYERPEPIKFLSAFENKVFYICGIKGEGQDWKKYTFALVLLNILGILIVFLIQRIQYYLPLNPRDLPAVPWDLALNTAVSFVTHTNWQAYAGETTLSYFSQMAGLTWQNFAAAATAMGAFFALARGITQHGQDEKNIVIGNFWVDFMRSILFVFLPGCFIFALVLVSQGTIQNFSSPQDLITLEGTQQTLAMGPAASQVASKLLGTNGGGFFNVNSAHPFENPTPFSNFLQMLALILIPAALTYTYGKIAKNQKDGWTLLFAMVILSVLGVACIYYFESFTNPLLSQLPLVHDMGNMEGKEVRFGLAGSSLYANLATDTSGGPCNSMYDSFMPLGGMILLINMLLSEVVFGGVGVGLFGMLMFVIISVFIAGLMVGRTPEYLGKKIEGKEVRFAILYVALYPLIILLGTAWSVFAPYGLSSILNHGPHGMSEILYAYTSAAENNGSAFAGLNANTPWYNLTLALTMFIGRFLSIILGLAIAGSMVNKKILAVSAGTFPTQGGLFIGLLIGVILIVGALTFFPILALGPFTEHLFLLQGKAF